MEKRSSCNSNCNSYSSLEFSFNDNNRKILESMAKLHDGKYDDYKISFDEIGFSPGCTWFKGQKHYSNTVTIKRARQSNDRRKFIYTITIKDLSEKKSFDVNFSKKKIATKVFEIIKKFLTNHEEFDFMVNWLKWYYC